MDGSAWSTQQLAEFVASVSACTTEAAATRAAVERAAEALDADVAAIVCGGEVIAAVGYAENTEPVGELTRIRPGAPNMWLNVPGAGRCPAAAAALAYPPGATLVLARPGGLTRQETGLLRGMARTAAITMRMLSVLDHERGARKEVEWLAREQVALRRVATLVAKAASPEQIFSAVAQEVAQLSGADMGLVLRYEADGTATMVGGWGRSEIPTPIGTQLTVDGEGVAVSVLRTGQPSQANRFNGPPGSVADSLRQAGVRASSGSPIIVAGQLWGVVITAATRLGGLHPEIERRMPVFAEHAATAIAKTSDEPLPADTEKRLAGFTDLVATAIANAAAQAELTASRARIVATADQTRRRIERDLHDGAQQRLVTLALQLQAARARVPPQHDQLIADLDRVVAGLTSTLEELREYARGIHPAILALGGLGSALKTLARRSPVPVRLDIRMRERLPEHVEVTAYYVISEALANTAKHANASSVQVEIETTSGVLRLDVHDDGVGGADLARGSGLIGLKDRVEAIGGTFTIKSRPDEGTRLLIELPAPVDPRAVPCGARKHESGCPVDSQAAT